MILAPPPPSYHPFSVLDILIEEEARAKEKKSKTAGLAGQLKLGAKLNKTVGNVLYSPCFLFYSLCLCVQMAIFNPFVV